MNCILSYTDSIWSTKAKLSKAEAGSDGYSTCKVTSKPSVKEVDWASPLFNIEIEMQCVPWYNPRAVWVRSFVYQPLPKMLATDWDDAAPAASKPPF